MKIKNILPFLCSLVLFSAASVMAQSDPGNFSTPPAADPAIHLGQNNPYKIGTPEDPVTAEEYCAFLYQATGANETTKTPYYDVSFMIKKWWDRFGFHVTSNPNACISFTVHAYNYSLFDLLQGHANDIIDGVQSQRFQNAFNEWRLNPKASELCDYINAMISGDTDTALSIKSKYPSSNASTIFGNLDMYAQNYVLYYPLHDSFYFVLQNYNKTNLIWMEQCSIFANCFLIKEHPIQAHYINLPESPLRNYCGFTVSNNLSDGPEGNLILMNGPSSNIPNPRAIELVSSSVRFYRPSKASLHEKYYGSNGDEEGYCDLYYLTQNQVYKANRNTSSPAQNISVK